MNGKFAYWILATAVFIAGCATVSASESMLSTTEVESYSLERVMQEPDQYAGREVFFLCRFADLGELFKPQQTRFTANDHVNFAVWPENAQLWSEEARKNGLPTLYVAKRNKTAVQTVQTFGQYQLIAVTGRVTSTYANTPWVLVSKIEAVTRADARLDPEAVAHLRAGLDSLTSDDIAAADWHFDSALSRGMPAAYNAAASEFSARAKIATGDLHTARERLESAITQGKDEPLLYLALADLCLKTNDPEMALEYAATAAKQPALSLSALGIQAEAQALQGDLVAAFNTINQAASTPGISVRSDALLDVHRARIYKRAGRTADASTLYSELVQANKPLADELWLNDEVGSYHEALFLANGGVLNLDIAYECFERCVTPGRSGLAALQKMAEIEFRKQNASVRPDLANVKTLVTRMYSLLPEYIPARILEARILGAWGRLDEASRLYTLVVEHINDDFQSLVTLANAYADLGHYEQASILAARATSIRPWDERPIAISHYIASLPSRQNGNTTPVQPGNMKPSFATSGMLASAPAQIAEPLVFIAQTSPSTQAVAMTASATAVATTVIPAEAANPYDMDIAIHIINPMVDVVPDNREISWFDFGPQPQMTLAQVNETYMASAAPAYQPVNNTLPVTNVILEQKPVQVEAKPLAIAPVAWKPLTPVTAEVPALKLQDDFVDFSVSLPTPLESNAVDIFGDGFSFAHSIPLTITPVESPALNEPVGNTATGPIAFGNTPPVVNEQDSPLLIAGYVVEKDSQRDLPIRNANLYRKSCDGGRRPAEIIEGGDPIKPATTNPRLSAMSASGDGKTHKTQVLLPSSPQGIGIDTELEPLPY